MNSFIFWRSVLTLIHETTLSVRNEALGHEAAVAPRRKAVPTILSKTYWGGIVTLATLSYHGRPHSSAEYRDKRDIPS